MKRIDEMTEPELRDYFKYLAGEIESRLPPATFPRGKCMFVLLVMDESQIAQYVSNAERDSIPKMLRETADILDSRKDIPR